MALSTSLTDDILIEIFSFLPLNSIYKFRCLSKVWLSNLSNPNFITKWFQINKKSLPWIQYHSIVSLKYRLSFRKAYPESHSDFMSRNDHLFCFKFLRKEIPFRRSRLYLLGSSNGLVLCESKHSDGQRRYHVCNPLTQKWVTLPSTPSQVGPLDVSGIVCEYSSSFTSCYKVVHIPKFGTPSKKFIVDIFSSDLGAWESIEVSCDADVVWEWSYPNNVVILDGVLYWVDGLNRMLAYNLNQNNGSGRHGCSLINLPDGEFDDYSYDSDCILGESEGRVCYAETKRTVRKTTVIVWVLDDLNWQILHKSILVDDTLAEVCSVTAYQCEPIQVLGFSPVDRNVVLLGWKGHVCGYCIKTRSVVELCSSGRHGYDAGKMIQPFVLKPMPTILQTL